jgi:hypothetical protein
MYELKQMNKKSILLSLLFFVLHGFSMDQPGVLLSQDMQVFGFVFNCLKHKDIRSFAETNKNYNKYMCDTAVQRKKLLRANIGIAMGSFIHKYGSKRFYVCRDSNLKGRLWLRYTKINTLLSAGAFCFEGFIAPLPHEPAPFFDNQGNFSFYGYGTYECSCDKTDFHPALAVIKYSWDGTGKPCAVLYNCPFYGILCGEDLHLFLEYPILLRTIMESMVRIQTKNWFTSKNVGCSCSFLTFSLNSVILPDDYAGKIAISDITMTGATNNFEGLREGIRKAIEKRYAVQSKNDVASTR